MPPAQLVGSGASILQDAAPCPKEFHSDLNKQYSQKSEGFFTFSASHTLLSYQWDMAHVLYDTANCPKECMYQISFGSEQYSQNKWRGKVHNAAAAMVDASSYTNTYSPSHFM